MSYPEGGGLNQRKSTSKKPARKQSTRNKSTKSGGARSGSDNRDRIVTMILQIPRGRVATYGQIARLAGIPKNSRQVGFVLKTLPVGDSIPWFRVVNSKGEISQRGNRDCTTVQREALEEEAVEFDDKGRVSLSRFQWEAGLATKKAKTRRATKSVTQRSRKSKASLGS